MEVFGDKGFSIPDFKFDKKNDISDEEMDAYFDRIELEKKTSAFNSHSRIEPEHKGCSFENFEAVSTSQKQALEAMKNLVEKMQGYVILIGKNGTGKTHLAAAAMNNILKGVIYSMYEISASIRASYVYGAKETELQIVDRLSKEQFLVIDEIGRTKGSDTEKNWLSYIIDKRHTRRLPTVLISNNHMIKNCKQGGCDKCLENYFDNDLLSRFSQDSKVINMDGEDYRRSGKVRK